MAFNLGDHGLDKVAMLGALERVWAKVDFSQANVDADQVSEALRIETAAIGEDEKNYLTSQLERGVKSLELIFSLLSNKGATQPSDRIRTTPKSSERPNLDRLDRIHS